MSRLEQGMQQILSVVGNRPQENTGPKIAAFQPTTVQSADEELRYLREQARQLKSINSEEHFNTISSNRRGVLPSGGGGGVTSQ